MTASEFRKSAGTGPRWMLLGPGLIGAMAVIQRKISRETPLAL